MMIRPTTWARGCALATLAATSLWVTADRWVGYLSATDAYEPQPTQSSPIAITSDDRHVWSVNPDNNSVSVFNVRRDANKKIADVYVGKEPWCVAITPNARKVYVTNMASGTVSVIDARYYYVMDTIQVGAEPFGCAITPDGKQLYVANQSSDSVSVINTRRDRVVDTIYGVGSKPHSLAIDAGGRKVYVTQFLALPRAKDPRPLTRSEGADDGREGRVSVIDTYSNRVVKSVVLNPLADAGFKSDGNTLAREPLTTVFDNVTGAFPNLLESVFIKGNIAYIPNTCSSPNGPFRFNVNVQSCLSSIDTDQNKEAFTTLNMNSGVAFEPVGTKLFNTNPFAVAFKRSKPEGFVTLGATDRLLRVTLNDQGQPSINPPSGPGNPGGIVRIVLKDPRELAIADPNDTIGGKNPRGIVLNSTDTRAYVMDFTSRDIAVVDISGDDPAAYQTTARVQSADLPAEGSQDAIVQRGKRLFNSAIGPEGATDTSKRPAGRMSDTGWGTCYSCHPSGLTDTVTWMFPDGPRQAISMESTFERGAAVIVNGAPALPDSHMRALNWSAVRDEVQDFERNIRAVSGGGGLISNIPEAGAGLTQVPDLVGTANTGRSVDFDAIATYLAVGVRAPISPLSSKPLSVRAGREVFAVAGCQNCHGGPNWTVSRLDYTPPAVATDVVDAQLVRFLCRVGTFDANLFTDGVSHEIRANTAANTQARGTLGFNVPSLISVFASAPYLHDGAAATLEDVLENPVHRQAGNPGGVDILSIRFFRQLLAEFLKSIDKSTKPFDDMYPPADACGPIPS